MSSQPGEMGVAAMTAAMMLHISLRDEKPAVGSLRMVCSSGVSG